MCKNQNYNKRSLIATLVVLAVCLVIVTGSTFSLFTSKTGVNIAVTAANVKMTATINQSSLELSSMGNKLEGNTFENGGKADFNANFTGLDLTYITPGDKATFTIDLVNTSNVNIQYRVTWKLTNAEGDTLANYLNVIVGDKKLELNAPTSEWTLWEPSNNAEDMTKSIKVSVEFPTNLWADETDEVRYANYRELMNNIANIEFAVEAVQGNGTYAFTAFVNSEEGLQNAINAGATDIILTGDIVLEEGITFGTLMSSRSGDTTEANTGITIDLNGYAITAAEDSEADIVNLNKEVTFVGGTLAVDITNYATLVAEEVKFENCKVVSDGNDATFEMDEDCTGTLEIKNYYIDEKTGVEYYTDGVTGDIVLYSAAGCTVEELVIPEGVTYIANYAFSGTNVVKTVTLASTILDLGRGFDSASSVEKVVLNEGLTTISSRAFKATTALKEVVFSSTITSIADNAFQKSAIKEIVIPASVTTVGEAAFGASLIEKVTFEGNTNIEGYAFRGCPNLRTVYLNGMDVNFVASRLNGRNNCWFCNGESNNPNTSKITFYVKTNVIKERVLTAMGAEKNNTPVIVEFDTTENGYDVDENGVAYVYTADALVAALEAKRDVVFCCDIKIEPASMSNAYGATGINVKYGQTIDGNGYTLNIKGAGGTWDSGINTTGGIIKNLTVTGSFRGIFVNHTSTHSEKVVLENVIITGTTYTISCDQGLNQGLVATNCTFNGWTSFAATIGSVEFNNCTFGKGNGYAYCRPYAPTVFNNCVFSEGYKLDTSKVSGLVFNDCTYSDGLFYNGYNGAIFNGSVCVCTADELIAAINAAEDDATIYLAAGEYSLRFTNHITFNVDNLTIKGLGEVKLAISSSEAWYGRVQGSNVTFENIHFTSSVGATGKATYNNCTFDSWAICASSNNEETYYNNCTINGCLNTSTDFSSGDVHVKDCQIVKAEYSGSMTMNFENCQIGEVIIWNTNTNFTNCDITTRQFNVTTAKVTIK